MMERLEQIVDSVPGLYKARCSECEMMELSGRPFTAPHICEFCARDATEQALAGEQTRDEELHRGRL